MKLVEIITESVQSKGTLKALFLAGPPGAGKTTFLNSVRGSLPSNVAHITMDRYIEHVKQEPTQRHIISAKIDVAEELSNAVNHVAPIIVDTTGMDETRLLARKQTLEQIGYDVGMIWLDVSYETSLARVAKREQELSRTVPQGIIQAAHEHKHHALARYQQQFGRDRFVYVNVEANDGPNNARAFVSSFFNGSVENQKGKQILSKMKELGANTLYPKVIDSHVLKYIPQGWYQHWSR